MWIIKVALDRPYTFIVLALLILLVSPVIILNTPTDIFPNIDIPVVAVGWVYTGLSPQELEGRLTSVYERLVTATVDNIEHIESNTVNGQVIVKIFLQPGTNLPMDVNKAIDVARYLDVGRVELMAISLGSVWFGAMTYIGNGPNFMVKAIADHAKIQTPGFIGFIVKYTLPFMVPMLLLIWLLFFH